MHKREDGGRPLKSQQKPKKTPKVRDNSRWISALHPIEILNNPNNSQSRPKDKQILRFFQLEKDNPGELAHEMYEWFIEHKEAFLVHEFPLSKNFHVFSFLNLKKDPYFNMILDQVKYICAQRILEKIQRNDPNAKFFFQYYGKFYDKFAYADLKEHITYTTMLKAQATAATNQNQSQIIYIKDDRYFSLLKESVGKPKPESRDNGNA